MQDGSLSTSLSWRFCHHGPAETVWKERDLQLGYLRKKRATEAAKKCQNIKKEPHRVRKDSLVLVFDIDHVGVGAYVKAAVSLGSL